MIFTYPRYPSTSFRRCYALDLPFLIGNTDMIREREEEIRQGASETEEDPLDGYGHRSFFEGGEQRGGGGISAQGDGRRAPRNSRRPVSKCYPACKKGQSSLRRARGACGADSRAVQHARAISTRVPAWPARCAECHRQARRTPIRRLSPLNRASSFANLPSFRSPRPVS